MYLKRFLYKLAISISTMFIPAISNAFVVSDRGDYFFTKKENLEITFNKYSPHLSTIVNIKTNERLTFNEYKNILSYYKSNPLGSADLKIKYFNRKKLLHVSLDGPKISFNEDCNSSVKNVETLKEIAKLVPSQKQFKEEKKLISKFHESCLEDKIVNMSFFRAFKSSFDTNENPSKCLQSPNMKKYFKESPSHSLSALLEEFNRFNEALVKNPELVQIACYKNFNDVIHKSSSFLKEFHLTDANKPITLFGFNISNDKSKNPKCASYYVLHEMIHLFDQKLTETAVDDIMKKCKTENKEVDTSCEKSAQSTTYEFESKCIIAANSTCGDGADSVTEQFKKERSEQAELAVANRLPVKIMDPIPDTAVKSVTENPVGSSAFNDGMNIIANSLINKLNFASSTVERAIADTAPNQNFQIPKVNITNPHPDFAVWKRSDFENDPDFKFYKNPDSNTEDDASSLPPITKGKTDNSKKNSKISSNSNPTTIATSKSLPMISNSLEFPESIGAENTLSESDRKKVDLGKINSALNSLLKLKTVEGKEYSIIKTALADKGQIGDLLSMLRFAIVDSNKRVFFKSSQKPNTYYQDDGSSLKEITF